MALNIKFFNGFIAKSYFVWDAIMDSWRREIKDRWISKWPDQYWGDDLDVRYLLVKHLKAIHSKKVLDVGCNTGVILGFMPDDNERWGLDHSEKLVHEAKHAHPKCNFIVGDAKNIPFGDNEFDVVLLVNLIECFSGEERMKVLLEAARVLKPGGKIYLTTPNKGHYYYRKTKKLDMSELERLLEKTGLSYDILGFNPIPLPTKSIAWLPGVYGFLEFLSGEKAFAGFGKYFCVEAKKSG